MPIFRSDAQARILAWLLLDPSREQPISTLVPVSGAAQPNTLREVNQLLRAGLLVERRAGRTRMVRANVDSPYFQPLTEILARAYGPLRAVPEALADVPGIEEAYIVGSWAERFHGRTGLPPRDVDVIVVGNPNGRALRRATTELELRLSVPVQVTTVSRQDWETSATPFITQVRARHPLRVLPEVDAA